MTAENKPDIPQELEAKIEEFAKKFWVDGRKDWDEPHSKAVAYYAGEIARAEGLDVLVLETVGKLHDIGYSKLFKGDDSQKFDKIMFTESRALHMVRGALAVKTFLESPEIAGYYTKEQKEEIVHLISVHDNIEELETPNEIALMEADTLGAIDIKRVKTTFNKEDAMKYVKTELLGRRIPRFKTQSGIDFSNVLIPDFLAQFVQ